MFLRLYAFGQALAADFLDHVDGIADDGTGLVRRRREEMRIQLDDIEVIILEDVERRIAAAKIVHENLVASLEEASQGLFDDFFIVDQHGLRDFQMDEVPRQAICPDRIFDDLEDVAEEKVQTRQIEGYRDDGKLLIQAAAQGLAGLAQDVAVEFIDVVVLFQDGNEAGRRQEADDGVIPAGQGFHAADGTGQGADDRLIIDLDPAVLNSVITVSGNVVVDRNQLLQVLGIFQDGDAHFIADVLAGDFGIIHGQSRVDDLIFRKMVDAGLDFQLVLAIDLADGFMKCFQLFPHRPFRREQLEVVIAATRQEALREGFPNHGGQAFQAVIADGDAIADIDELEVDDVEIDQAVSRQELTGFHEVPDILEEAPVPGQAGHVVDVAGQVFAVVIGDKDVIDLTHAGQGDFAAEVFCIAYGTVTGDDAVAGITGLADVARRLLADILFYQFPVPQVDHAAEAVMDVVGQFFVRSAAKKADDIVTGIEQCFPFIGFINKDSPGQALGDAGRQSGLVLPVHLMFHASISRRNIFYISYIPSVYFCIYFYFIILQA